MRGHLPPLAFGTAAVVDLGLAPSGPVGMKTKQFSLVLVGLEND
jgi:hypothetical protein